MNLEEENEGIRDALDETIRVPADSGEPNPEGDHKTGEPPGRFSRIRSRFGSARTVAIAGSAALFLVLSGTLLFWFLSPSVKAFRSAGPPGPPPPAVLGADASNRAVTQDLKPFYIPLPAGRSGRMARVTLSVTWDPPSSKRFQGRETHVRDRLYKRLVDLAADAADMRGMSLTIRSEAQHILEELLRPDELRLVVTGILIV